MNKSKTKKLALVTTVTILVICFLPTVQGKRPALNIRPIDDWLYNNPYGAGTGYLDPVSMLAQRCLGPGILGDPSIEYEGIISERLRVDQSLHITIHISVKGMPMAIRDFTALGESDEWIFYGVMDFTYTAEVILEKKIPGGPLMDWMGDIVPDNKGELQPLIVPSYGEIAKGKREPGAELPVWWILYYYLHEVGGHFVMTDFISDASGHYIEPGWSPFPWSPFFGGEPIPYEAGNVEVHQLAYFGYDLDLEDPAVLQWTVWTAPEGVLYEGGPLKQSPLCMPETWPFEYVRFY